MSLRIGLSIMFTMTCAPALAEEVMVSSGTLIRLETTKPLSSKTNVKGDMVALRTVEDVKLGDRILIPRGTEAMGQVVDARAKGAMGMSGRLTLAPLYVRVRGRTVRLIGQSADKGSVTAGAVVGMALLSPGFTGRSAEIADGTQFAAYVDRSTMVEVE